MQFSQLRYVVAVAERGSFTVAAETLRVAQPSVSSAVRALERELGATLFHRGRSEVTPTAAGEAFLPWARQALSDADRGRAVVDDLLGLRAGRLDIGATPSLATSRLPGVLAAYHRAYPAIELAVRQAGSRELVSALSDGLVELALVILPTAELAGGAELVTLALATEELVLAVAVDHPLAAARSVTAEDLRDLPMVVPRPGYDLREATFALCREAGFEPRVTVEAGEMDGVLALAAAGLGAAVVPVSVTGSSRIVAVSFAGGSLTRTLGLAERADRPRSAAAEAFVIELVTRIS